MLIINEELKISLRVDLDTSGIQKQLNEASKQLKFAPTLDTSGVKQQVKNIKFEDKQIKVKAEVENLGNILKGDNKGLSNSAKSYIANLNKEIKNASKSIDLTPITQEVNKTLSNVDIQKNLFAGFEKLKSGEAYGTLTPINNMVNELKKVPPEAKNATEAYAKFNEELKKGQRLQESKEKVISKLSLNQGDATNQNIVKYYDELIKKIQQISSLTGKGTTADGKLFNLESLQKDIDKLNKANKTINDIADNIQHLKRTAVSDEQKSFVANLERDLAKLPTDLQTAIPQINALKREVNEALKINPKQFAEQYKQLGDDVKAIVKSLNDIGQTSFADKISKSFSEIGTYSSKSGSQIAKLSSDISEANKRLEKFSASQKIIKDLQSEFKGSPEILSFLNQFEKELGEVNLQSGTYYRLTDSIETQGQKGSKGLQEQANKVEGLKSKYGELLSTLKGGIDLNVGGSQKDVDRITELQNKLRNLNVSPDIKKNADDIKEITNEVKKLESDLGKGQLLGTAKSQFNSLNLTVKSATEIVKQFNTEAKSIKVSNISQTGDWKTFNAQIQQADGSLKSVKMSVNSVTNEVRQLDRGLATANNSLLQAIKNMLGIGSATMIAYKAFAMLKNAVGVVIELSDAMIELQMITQQSAESVEESVKQYQQLASELSSTTSAVTKAAIEFSRQGRSAADTTELLKTSQVFSKVGFLESTEAAELLTSAINGYKIEAKDAMSVVDKMSAIDVTAATSTKELATALQYTAASADLAGVSLDETLAYIATISSVTRRSSESIGQSLKTIFARMQAVKLGSLVDPESGEDVSDVETVLEQYDITLRNLDGTFRDTSRVLDELATKWNTFNNAQQSEIATVIAGVRQKENLLVLLSNYSTAQDLVTESINSTGSAMEKFNIYQESTSAGMERVRNQAEILATNIISGKLVKSFINATEAILTFANTGLGTFITQGTLVAVAIIAITQAVSALNKSFKTLVITKFASEMMTAAKSAYAYTQALAAMNVVNGMGVASNVALAASFEAVKAAFYSLPIIGQVALAVTALVGVVSAAVKVYDHYNESLEEHRERIANLQNEYNQAKSNVESLKSELEQVNAKIEEINKNNLALTPNAEEELQNLKNYSDELNRQLEIEKALVEIRGKELDVEAKTGLEKTKTLGITDSFQARQLGIGNEVDTVSITGTKIEVTEIENFQLLTYQYEKAIKKSKELEEQKKKLEATGQEESDTYKQVVKDIKANSIQQGELSNSIEDSYNTLKLYDSQLLDSDEQSKAYKDTIASVFDEFIKISSIETPDISLTSGGIEESKASFNSLKQVIEDMSNKNELLSSAFSEMNDNGEISAETYVKLREGLADYADYLELVGGKLVFNSQKYYDEAMATEKSTIATNNKTIADYKNAIANKEKALSLEHTSIAAAQAYEQEIKLMQDEISYLELDNAIREQNVNAMYEQVNGLTALGEQVDDMVSAYNSLNSIIDEYNENGEISLQSLKSLLELEPQYISAIEVKNGKLVVSEANTKNLVEAMKQAKIAELQAAFATDVAAYASGNYAEMSDLAKQAVSDFNTEVSKTPSFIGPTIPAITSVTAGLGQLADGYRKARAEASGGFVVDENKYTDEALKGIYAIRDVYVEVAGIVDSASKSVGNISSSSYKSEKQKEKEIKMADDLIDRYSIINSELQKNDNSLATISRLNEDIDKNSEAYVYNLNKEIELLEKKQKLLNEENNIRRKNLVENQKELLTYGIKFEVKGNDVKALQSVDEMNKIINKMTKEQGDEVAKLVESMFSLSDEAAKTSEDYWKHQQKINQYNLELLTYDIEGFVSKNERTLAQLDYALSGLGENDFDKKLILLNQELSNQVKVEQFLNKEQAELKQAFIDGKISVADYKEEMSKLDDQILDNAISQQQLTQNIKETTEAQSQAQVDAYKEYYELVKEYYIQGVNDQIEALEDLNDAHKIEIDALKDTLDAQKEQTENAIEGLEEQLDLQKQLYDAEIAKLDLLKKQRDEQNTLDDFNKEISKLEEQIVTLTGDEKSNTTRLKLEEELANKRSELEDYLFDQDIENRKSSLEASLKADEAEIESKKKQQEKILELVEDYVEEETKRIEDMIKDNELEIEKLQDSIKDAGQVSIDVINLINTGGKDLFDKLQAYSAKYKDVFEDNALDTITQFKENWNDTIPTLETVLELSRQIAEMTSMGVGSDLSNMEVVMRDALEGIGQEVIYNAKTGTVSSNGKEFNPSDFGFSLVNGSYTGKYSNVTDLLNYLGLNDNLYSNMTSGVIGASASSYPINNNNSGNTTITNKFETNITGATNEEILSKIDKQQSGIISSFENSIKNIMASGGTLKRSYF